MQFQIGQANEISCNSLKPINDSQNFTPSLNERFSIGMNKIEEPQGGGGFVGHSHAGIGAGLLKVRNHRERHSSRVRLVDIQRQELQTSPMDT
mmetsp:Transcript_5071/g.7668  ORF Transcript_5071/g.7668 Transcript_5071/m.7668 type:complete len:93 (+) Transcript_5071:6492-6770(+)